MAAESKNFGVWSIGWEEKCGSELSFELGFCCSIAYRVVEFIPRVVNSHKDVIVIRLKRGIMVVIIELYP